jgi:hypothetical protein
MKAVVALVHHIELESGRQPEVRFGEREKRRARVQAKDQHRCRKVQGLTSLISPRTHRAKWFVAPPEQREKEEDKIKKLKRGENQEKQSKKTM